MKLSVVIPARNEEDNIESTLADFSVALTSGSVPHEIIVVDDGSTDHTQERARRFAALHDSVVVVENLARNGFGMAVRVGLSHATGDAAAVVMADASDSPEDLLVYYGKLLEGYDCVFGSRFIRGAAVIDYP